MTLKQITKDNFPSLLRCVDPSPDLMGKLRSVPFLEDQIHSVTQQFTEEQKVNRLLDTLLEVPDEIQESVMNRFISALRSDDQEHVANIFRRESDKVPMSDEHHHTLTADKGQIRLYIDPENGLLAELRSAGVISRVDENDIRAMPGYNEKARKLTEILARKSDDAFDSFINALSETGQSHVTFMLTGEGNSRPLKKEHRKRLLANNRDYLVKMIDSTSSGLITALMSKGVFSSDDEQRVTSVQPDTTDNRNEIILNLMARKSQSDFFSFISALHDTNQTHVAVQLIGVQIVAKIEAVYQSGGDVTGIEGVEEDLLKHMREVFQRNGDEVRRINKHLSYNRITVTDIREGCIAVTFACENNTSLRNCRNLHDSGKLREMFSKAFCSKFASNGLKSLTLEIDNEQFEKGTEAFTRCVPMTSEHRQALLSSEKCLVEKIRIGDDWLDKLSLCKRRRQAIKRAETHEQQVKTLIDIVLRQPDSAFDQLLNALRDTGQHEAAGIISGISSTATERNK